LKGGYLEGSLFNFSENQSNQGGVKKGKKGKDSPAGKKRRHLFTVYQRQGMNKTRSLFNKKD